MNGAADASPLISGKRFTIWWRLAIDFGWSTNPKKVWMLYGALLLLLTALDVIVWVIYTNMHDEEYKKKKAECERHSSDCSTIDIDIGSFGMLFLLLLEMFLAPWLVCYHYHHTSTVTSRDHPQSPLFTMIMTTIITHRHGHDRHHHTITITQYHQHHHHHKPSHSQSCCHYP